MLLSGCDLTIGDVVRVARDGVPAQLTAKARQRMAEARAVVERYLAEGRPAYGLTTGLGDRATEALTPDQLADFSLHTVRGRANAAGTPLATDAVRATLLVRANGLARGGSGARPELAEALVELLDRRVHPVVPSLGSVGAGDICLLAHVGLVLVGEGEAEIEGEVGPGADALRKAGIAPLPLAPKDGLALINANSPTVAQAALSLADGRGVLAALQVAAALSLAAFRANPSPLDPRVAAARPAPGQVACAAGLRALLAGGSSSPRRIQDPLSLRCVSQVHGSLLAALDFFADAVEPELNAAADNPLVLADDGEILSTGNFHVPALAVAADTVALALAQSVTLSGERVARLLSGSLAGLPRHLAGEGSTGAGLAPLLKLAGALRGGVKHGAMPASLAAGEGGGVEDAETGAPLAVARLSALFEQARLQAALELVVAARAVDLAGGEVLGHGTAAAHAMVQELVPSGGGDQSLGGAVEELAARIDAVVDATGVVAAPWSRGGEPD